MGKVTSVFFVLALLCGSVSAQQPINAIDISGLQGTYLLKIDGDSVTIVPMRLTKPAPGPVPPVTPPIPNPSSLTDTVRVATATVPEYPSKPVHRRAMATSMTFLAPFLGAVPLDQARATVKAACDGACGADSQKWSTWWATVDAKLNGMALAPQGYQAALAEMAGALTNDLPAASANDENRGLPPEVWQMLLKILLQLLEQLFKSGATAQ